MVAECPLFSFFQLVLGLSTTEQRVAELIGVLAKTLDCVECVNNQPPKSLLRDAKRLACYQRFWVTLILRDLIEESPLDEIIAKFAMERCGKPLSCCLSVSDHG